MKLPEVLTGAAALLAALAVARSDPTSQPDAHEHVPATATNPVRVAGDIAPVARTVIPSAPPPFLHGRSRMVYAPTPCDVPAFSPGGPGAPYVVADGVPRVGMPFRVEWTTKPTSPGEPPAWPALLLVSFNMGPPTPLDVAGAPGCHLLVQPDFIMLPRSGSILTQSGGHIRLNWTPRPPVMGQDLYGQLLVSAPGVNAGGFLVSPALHVVVGS